MLQTKETRDDFVVEDTPSTDTSVTGSYAGLHPPAQEELRKAFYGFVTAQTVQLWANLEGGASLVFEIPNQASLFNLRGLTNQLATTESLHDTGLAIAPYTDYDDILLDEPLKPLPVKTGTVRGFLRYAGKGEPILQGDTELHLFEDGQ